MKNIHPLRSARRRAERADDPPKPQCPFCLQDEHTAGRNHDFELIFSGICPKHQDQITEARRDADVSMVFERNPVKRVALALKATSVFLHMLADAMWRWATLLENQLDDQ